MTFKPGIWQPIAIVLSAVNLVAVGQAAGAAEPWHAAGHAALALGLGLWAQRLGPARGGGGSRARLEGLEAEVSELRGELGDLRGELSEAQERLDFAERLLAQGSESRRVGPDR